MNRDLSCLVQRSNLAYLSQKCRHYYPAVVSVRLRLRLLEQGILFQCFRNDGALSVSVGPPAPARKVVALGCRQDSVQQDFLIQRAQSRIWVSFSPAGWKAARWKRKRLDERVILIEIVLCRADLEEEMSVELWHAGLADLVLRR